ncbi:MAG: hypothetical protein HFG89_09770 [Dorea sp.]|jgi:hypothetical protein|nr:hypothetical protein [Dorea sp.]
MNDKGYVFRNYFDAVCYLVISTIYPLLTFFVQSTQLSGELILNLNFLITGVFFSATFFYDYYQRYRDCDEQTSYVVNILHVGRLLFAFLLFFAFFFLVLMIGDFSIEFNRRIMHVALFFPSSALLPLIMAIVDIVRWLSSERKGKISKVQV